MMSMTFTTLHGCSDNIRGLELGREIGLHSFTRASLLINGVKTEIPQCSLKDAAVRAANQLLNDRVLLLQLKAANFEFLINLLWCHVHV